MNAAILKPGRERSLARRHPWIFSGAIASEAGTLGETVEVRSARNDLLGYGAYSPASMIRVRMISFDPNEKVDATLIRNRVAAAVRRRAPFLAGTYTNATRLICAESDLLPGVVADVYAGHIVCQFTSAFAEVWKREIAQALLDVTPGAKGVSERTDLKDRHKEGLATSTSSSFLNLLGEEPPEAIEIFEGPCTFLVDVRHGHKTGFYLDQRAARAAVGRLAKGAEVLNCFSYTGGFGLFARANGAKNVTQVDISADALALAKRNEALSSPSDTEMEYVEADVFEYLRKCRDAGRRFDLIVLDPPKFASVKAQVMKAARGYKDINLLAMKLLKPNGILATFSCSGAMTSDLFDKILAEAAEDAKRDFQILERTTQDADHPVALSFPEGLYLKGIILRSLT